MKLLVSLFCIFLLFPLIGCSPTTQGNSFEAETESTQSPSVNSESDSFEASVPEGSTLEAQLNKTSDDGQIESLAVDGGEDNMETPPDNAVGESTEAQLPMAGVEGEDPGSPTSVDTSSWQNYTEPSFGFTIQHPSTLRVINSVVQNDPSKLVSTIQFVPSTSEDDSLLNEKLTIEIFEINESVSLEEWVKATDPYANSEEWQLSTQIVGNNEGLVVQTQLLVSPGWFFYLKDGTHIYKLTPNGNTGMHMINSFQIG